MTTFLIINCVFLLVHLATVIFRFAILCLKYGFDPLTFVHTLMWVIWTMALVVKAEELFIKVQAILYLADRGAKRRMKGKL